ncbi:hypothetical protein [Deinococcus ficus]|uniref:hypothetical protein n=1 Tax=Deinococcus ficus TaxID=317577 RepID=UPI001749FB9C|nr:hypothetical protein [Deinococcus ficus]GHF88153.1 hypothetical protein GCM10017782_26750 [Deinococcus ficus]
MKRNAKVLALMALMAAGTASAATEAGISIINIASAAFDIVNPDGTTKKGDPVTSNPVTTTVKAVPNFTITPNDGVPLGVPNQDLPGQEQSAVPGQTMNFPYVVNNTGNTPLIVQLDPRIASTNVDRTDTQIEGPTSTTVIEYSYINTSGQKVILTDTNGDGLVELPVLASGAPLNITQTYKIPLTATDTQKYGANPVGTALYDSSPVVGGVGNSYTETVLAPGGTTQLVDNDNFNMTTVSRMDGVVVGPLNDPDGNGTPTTPSYTNDQGYLVTPTATDSQSVSPTVVPSTVTFQNTLQNTGNRADVFDLPAPDMSQFPAGTTVSYTTPTGTALTDTDGDGVVDSGPVAVGGTFTFGVVIKYPPSGTTATQVAGTDSVVVTAVSSNDPTKNNITTNSVTVVVNAFDFGNPSSTDPMNPEAGTVGTPVAGQPGNPSTPVTPPTTCDANATTPKAAVPVQIVNLGSVSDYYSPTGTATITLANGGTRSVDVTYYTDAALTTPLADTAADTETANPDTGLIVSGGSITLYAAVVIPCDAANGPSITLNQTVTPGSGGKPLTDTNDEITVGTAGKLVLGKFVEGGTGGTTYGTAPYQITAPSTYGTGAGPEVAPGGTINYVIIGKNFYNAEVRNVILTDSLDLTQVNYVSGTCQVWSDPNNTPANFADDVLTSKTCTVNAPTTAGVVTTSAVNAVNLLAGEYVRMNLAVTVK